MLCKFLDAFAQHKWHSTNALGWVPDVWRAAMAAAWHIKLMFVEATRSPAVLYAYLSHALVSIRCDRRSSIEAT
jgi:hypothetical protein